MKLLFHGGGCGDSCCLRVQDLSVTIGSERILHDVNMHVHCGELVALTGPNGAGKRTLVKAGSAGTPSPDRLRTPKSHL